MKVLDALISVGKVVGVSNPIVGLVASGIECIAEQFEDNPAEASSGYRELGIAQIKLGIAMLEAAEDGVITEEELKLIKELSSDETETE